MSMIRCVVFLAALISTSCFSMDAVDLQYHLERSDLYVTEDPAPEGALPMSSIAIEQGGWYLFGLLAINDISLEDCMQSMAQRALKMGAHGVADVRVEYRPASFFRFSIFPIPDWSATITMTGMAFKMMDESAAFWRPRPAPSPGKDR